nr:hypothetical protein GCM10020093_005080 [Planobispora longispora]
MQLGHAVGAGALVADDRHEVLPVQLARLEGAQQLQLVVEDLGRGLDHQVLLLDGGDLDDRAAQVAVEHLGAAVGGERVAHRPEHVEVGAALGPLGPDQLAVLQIGGGAVVVEPLAGDREHVVVEQPRVEQVADEHLHAARGLEVVHVGLAVGVHPGQQRHGLGQVGQVVPEQLDAAAAAMATRCMVWLVEPPVASSATQALTIAFSSTTRPTGRTRRRAR